MTVQKSTDGNAMGVAFSAGGHKYSIPVPQSSFLPAIMALYENEIPVVDKVIEDNRAIKLDVDRSPGGQEKLFAPKAEAALSSVAAAAYGVTVMEAKYTAERIKLYAVPVIAPGDYDASNLDRERRDWLRSLDQSTALATLQQPGSKELRLAVLRSPIPLSAPLEQLVREQWNAQCREDHLAEFIAIDNALASVEWARRGLANLAGILRQIIRWSDDRVITVLALSSNEYARQGYGVFGFSQSDMEMAKLRIEAERHRYTQRSAA